VRVAEVDRYPGVDREGGVQGHLSALIAGERAGQVGGPGGNQLHETGVDLLGAVAHGQVANEGVAGERSTRARMAERLNASMIRSPSQCPGTARSATSAGSLLMGTMAPNKLARLACSLRARGRQRARPDRRAEISSLRSPPRPWQYSEE